MLRGEPKSARSSCRGHEPADRHELVTALGERARGCGLRDGPLVRNWKEQRHGRRNRGLRQGEWYVVLTHDLDFGAILAATHGEKPSVVQIRSDDVSLDVIGTPVMVALRQVTPELERGALLTLDPNRPSLGSDISLLETTGSCSHWLTGETR